MARTHATAALLRSMRPKQWTKNLIVFAPAIFGGVLLLPGNALRVVAAFGLMCLLSGAVYVLNDLRDVDADRAYERTRQRPLAAGVLDSRTAGVFAGGASLASLGLAWLLSPRFAAVLLAYLALQVAYTMWLKDLVVLDVLSIAGGFVLRAVAGAVVVGVPNSPWLLACAAFLVMFLALAKRRQELADLGPAASRHRVVLGSYTAPALDVMLASMLGATIVSYLVYTLLSAGARAHPGMVLTTPLVLYGLFRYLMLVYSESPSKTAEDVLLTDAPILVTVGLWLAAVVALIYIV